MTILDQPVAKSAHVEIDASVLWTALEDFFRGAIRQVQRQQAALGNPFASGPVYPASLEIIVDGRVYQGCIEEVNNVSSSLADAVVKISYVADRVYDRYVLVDLEDMGGPFGPRPVPIARQQRWMSASYYSS